MSIIHFVDRLNIAVFRKVVAEFLSDGDVLVGLLATTKAMQALLTGYKVKMNIPQQVDQMFSHNFSLYRIVDRSFARLTDPCRYLPISITTLVNVINPNLGAFSQLTSVTFGADFNTPLAAGMLPRSITHLDLADSFNQPLTRAMLPDELKQLRAQKFNHPLPAGTLPNSLQELCLESFDCPVLIGTLPDSLQELQLLSFNHPLDPGLLPASLTVLSLGKNFNQSIVMGALPASLVSLAMHTSFRQPIEVGAIPQSVVELDLGNLCTEFLYHGSIPSTVVTLKISNTDRPLAPGMITTGVKRLELELYNYPLAQGCFPDTLEYLDFGFAFNQAINPGTLPASLQYLEFGHYFNHAINPGTLSSSLKHIKFGFDFDQQLSTGVLPVGLEHLEIDDHYSHWFELGSLPHGLTILCTGLTGDSFYGHLHHNVLPNTLRELHLGSIESPLEPGMIPFGIVYLSLGNLSETLTLDVIPASVQRLELGKADVQVGAIPSSVIFLTLHTSVEQCVIPNSVTHLYLVEKSADERGMVNGTIPISVTHLIFGSDFRQLISSNLIPPYVTHLGFDCEFNQLIEPDAVPDSVTHVQIGVDFPHCAVLPPSVQNLSFHRNRDVTELPTFTHCIPRISYFPVWWM